MVSGRRLVDRLVPAVLLVRYSCSARTAYRRPVRLSFSFLLRGSRVVDLDPPTRREQVSQQSFQALGVSSAVGRRSPPRHPSRFRIQARRPPPALEGGDVLAKAPTGSGKTLAFAVPIVEDRGRGTLPRRSSSYRPASSRPRSPTSSGDRRRPRASEVAAYGGAPLQAQASGGAHVLVATPGRLQDLVERRLV